MTAMPPPRMTAEVAQDLRARHRDIPRTKDKYKTPEGMAFRLHLDDMIIYYGKRQCRRALGMSRSGFEYVLGVTSRPLKMPRRSEVEDLMAAVASVPARAKRWDLEYARVHYRLMELLEVYELPMIAKAAGVYTHRLARFTHSVQISPRGRQALSEASEPFVQYRRAIAAGRDPATVPEFIRALTVAATLISERDLARHFDMTIEAIRDLLDRRAG